MVCFKSSTYTLIGAAIIQSSFAPASAESLRGSQQRSLTTDMSTDHTDDDDLTNHNNMKVIYIIRHGEKVYMPSNLTAYKYACESEQGWARAYNMLSVFGPNRKNPVFRTPDALFSFNYDDETIDCKTSRGYYRTQATIAPLGKRLGIDINNTTGSKPDLCGFDLDEPTNKCHLPLPSESSHDFGPCCNVGAAEAIKQELFSDVNKINTILASWEHANIAFLANALGANGCKNKTTGVTIPNCSLDWSGDDFDSIYALYFDKDTREFVKIETNLVQGFDWIGPTEASTVDYNFGPGELPGID